jgi:Ca2+-binding RTX toxin-like protein
MHRFRSTLIAAALLIVALATIQGGAATSLPTSLPLTTAAEDEALVEIHLANREAIDGLLEMGVDLAEYRRDNPDGTVTVNAVVTPTERTFLTSLGYRFGATIEDRSTWEARTKERNEAIEAEQNSHAIAEDGLEANVTGIIPTLSPPTTTSSASEASAGPGEEQPPGEVTLMRADYFVHRSGRFLSVEARTALGTTNGGPTLSMAWAEDGGDSGATTTTTKFKNAGAYMYHRILVRVGSASSTTPVPKMVRVASSTGQFAEDEVKLWPGDDLPPYADEYMTGFHTHYMDPVEVYAKINALAVEFPNIAKIINLPNKTAGYQRKSMAVMGAATPGAAPQDASRAVLLESKAYGHEGGDLVQAEFVPGALTGVAVTGSKITVTFQPGTNAAQVISAINAHPAASQLVTAYPYAGNSGSGAVLPVALTTLDDFLAAPPHIPRGPFQPQVLRIGNGGPDQGKKVGVFLYCQQHAREWATPLTCVETAERLVRNYAIDPKTKEMVDNLDIFILPSVNPDGSLYSFYDANMQRKNLTRYCPLTAANGMPASRNSWGVDLNRNNTIGTYFDGYAGGGNGCTGETYSGPAEASEPEIRNEHWVVENFPNIKFSNNIHSYGGYFMWAPGSYVSAGRKTLPAPNIGIEAYFFEGAEKILQRIKESRGTVILPGRTGPVADVLYSAAGNSADEQWYRRDIIAYSFETGADLFASTETGTTQTTVGFQPNYADEGRHEANEFAAGNYGLLETALEYAYDKQAPVAEIKPNGALGRTPLDATFSWVNEPSVIHYTTDGSEPTESSPTWEARGPRQPGKWLHFDQTTTVKWIAEDIRGNMSPVQSATFVVDTVAPTTNATLSPDQVNGEYVQPTVTLDAVDAGGAGVDTTEYRLDGGDWVTYSAPFKVTTLGDHTLEYRSTDKVGNVEETKMLTFRVTSEPTTGPGCTITGTSAGDLINGTPGNDVICGLGGNDTINASGGNDLVLGGDGADLVRGGDGNDELRGDAGNDDLRGERGNDTLRGGAGNDKLNGAEGIDLCSVDADGGKATACES